MSGIERPAAGHLKAFALLALFALVTRGWFFGAPAINNDEQLYLVAGQRLLEGDWLYVDVWDRKPIGLFLIYAFICLVSPDPIYGYHVAAALFATLSGMLLFVIARRLTGFAAALGGAAAYLAWLLVFGGAGGQAPVFYNLPMAAAGALTFSLIAQTEDRRLTRGGCLIMLLVGLAIQIKYTAVFEGIFFGLSLLWLCASRGRKPGRLALDAAAWILCALAPTLLALAAYVAAGHGEVFVHANFVSVFKDYDNIDDAIVRLIGHSAGLLPFAACAAHFVRQRRRQDVATADRRCENWILAWAAASYAAFLFYGVWLDFYVLPVLMPLCLVAALAVDRAARPRAAIGAIVALGLLGGFGRALFDMPARGTRAEVDRVAAMVRPHLGKGCLYVNETLPVLYLLTKSCLPTRFIFPDHLTWDRYRDALGVDQTAEMQAMLSRQPSVIVIDLNPEVDSNPLAMRQLVGDRLKRNYRLVGRAKAGSDWFAVYALISK